MSIDPIENLALLNKPVLYIHPEEEHYPLSIVAYLQYCDVVSNNTGDVIQSGPITPLEIDLNSGSWPSDATFRVKKEFENDVKIGEWATNLANMYYRVVEKDSKIYITYIGFFGYNGAYPVFYGMIPLGAHWSDFEHITLQFDGTSMELERAYFGAHKNNEGRWVDKADIEMYPGNPEDIPRPVVHVAKIGHGLYPKSGAYLRFLGFANDLCAKAETRSITEWDSKFLIRLYEPGEPEYKAETNGWLKFNGTWGNGQISGPQKAPWWDNPDQQTEDGAPPRSTWDFESQDLVVITVAVAIAVGLIAWAILAIRAANRDDNLAREHAKLVGEREPPKEVERINI